MNDVMYVADAFLKVAKKNGKKLNVMQLNLLCVIAFGWCAQRLKHKLFYNEIRAGKRYPVIPDLEDLAGSSSRTIPLKEVDAEESAHVAEDEWKLICDVYLKYGKCSAKELIRVTTKDGTPWKVARILEIEGKIPVALFVEYAKALEAGIG